jgi:hypothetical protein
MATKTFNPFEGIGPLGTGITGGSSVVNASASISKFTNIISTIIGIMTVSAGLWFIFQLFGGAIQWLSSGGEKQGLQNAQKRIGNAVAGLLVVILSYAFISLIGRIFGLDILGSHALILGLYPQ